ncbi:MAG: hypothetical protein H6985_17280 [Pseudomonadales bacterium]|nr:hypothetical protein [Pseudomonadales bacterium]
MEISSKLSDDEWAMLNAYCEKVERLLATKLVASDDCDINGKVRYEKEKGLWFEASLPPEEVIAEFLMAFRFFYLKKEKTFFLRTLNILRKHIANADARSHFDRLKQRWENGLFSSAMSIQLNGEPMTTSLLLDLWLNAHYFHSDEDKSDKLKELNEAFSDEFSKYMMLDGAFEAVKAVFSVYDTIKDMVKARASNP